MTNTDWVEADPECWNHSQHLWKHTPDRIEGGGYLLDSEGGAWELRTCVLCGLKERRFIPDEVPA